MEKNILPFIFLIWNMISFGQSENNTLYGISSCTEIELTHTDDKCGEWGGNTEIIRFFKKDCKSEYYIVYSKRLMDCSIDPITHYKRKDFDEQKIILSTKEDRKLLELCIKELTEMKLSNPIIITHSGILNKVTSNDSTLTIKDYPSKEWSNFNRLKKSIMEK
ncbi:hypothetical protein ES676_14535 [Bizionia saleffrena]|uniref:Uncharacterized protein n=1 Tax=Bizionia saleffrena TaxID=291189 RepID=A0A8H2LJN4_9FLAO|nr:hypothetical protein [Bizionia saleffrena]TYB68696.1 hypothetical protein ES676_14535 [Bizionia saleffrena]